MRLIHAKFIIKQNYPDLTDIRSRVDKKIRNLKNI